MPREGVPYPERVLCSLKNTIAMIEQKLGLKIEKINGVGPDPSGNVTIVSDDAAITVEEDAAQHQVTIGLDRAELPSAAVTSVNGETGAVVLDASEIPYNDPDGYTDDVDEKLNVLTGVQNALQLSINQERTRAQNAESGLQNNINTLQASIPSEAAAAVAADPSIVRTFGDQDIIDIKTVPTQTTGQYSQQIANSQKVRNEIANLAILTTGNSTKAGQILFTSNAPLNTVINGGWVAMIGVQNETPSSTQNYDIVRIYDSANNIIFRIRKQSTANNSASRFMLDSTHIDANGVLRNNEIELECTSARTRLRMGRTMSDGTTQWVTLGEINE